MAMTKEQQKAASDRIMAKLGPLTEEEQVSYRRYALKPPYPETGEIRTCGICGAKFATIPAMKDHLEVTVLQQFSDHTAIHNPTPAQWTTAYERIQEGKERLKESTKAQIT